MHIKKICRIDTNILPTCIDVLTGYSLIINNIDKNSSTMYVRQGAVSIRKTVLPGMAIPMLKIRRPNGRLIFNMEIAIRR